MHGEDKLSSVLRGKKFKVVLIQDNINICLLIIFHLQENATVYQRVCGKLENRCIILNNNKLQNTVYPCLMGAG